MEIRIAGYLAATYLLDHEPARWHSVVILGAGAGSSGYAEARSPTCIALGFDDVLDPQPGKILPEPDEIRRGLDFARGKDRVLVTCRAGQGRSAALAYLIACQDRGPAAATAVLDATRHSPNRLVVKIGADLLGDPAVLGRFDGWRRAHARVRLADHHDRIEAEFDELERQGARNRLTHPA